jgi:hypothetical protein
MHFWIGVILRPKYSIVLFLFSFSVSQILYFVSKKCNNPLPRANAFVLEIEIGKQNKQNLMLIKEKRF